MVESTNTIATLKLAIWELVAQTHPSSIRNQIASNLLTRVQAQAPVGSLLIRTFDSHLQRLLTWGAAGDVDFVEADAAVECSPAKWQALLEWVQSNQTLRQSSLKRSGKLSSLAPLSKQNEVLAIVLPTSSFNMPHAVAVWELQAFRHLHEDTVSLLQSLAKPMGLMLRLNSNVSAATTSITKRVLSEREVSESIDTAQEAIIGSETGLKTVMERVQIVAPSDMPVLILGETGTGKEVVARAIHQRSPRADRPFIRVNCGAIPSELIDSQLFGHERGSFTGASDQRKGWFERADGGTLFLDEMGELPLAAQVRLLRVLQEHQIERVGGQEHIHVDVRIVAATHRDLSAMVHQKTFREDLWYRINMFPILLPRLCERINDIPALARHFAKRAAHRFGLPYVEPLPNDIKQLIDYRWPGNIRELQAVIDRAVILGGGAHLAVTKSLGNAFMQTVPVQPPPDEPTFYEVIPESIPTASATTSTISLVETDQGPLDTLDSAIVRHIERALLASNGQVEGKRGAAKLLGINPHTLRAKMRKLKIEWSRFRSE